MQQEKVHARVENRPCPRAVSWYGNTPRGAARSCRARLQRRVPAVAELTRGCSIIQHGLPPGSSAYPASPGGAAVPAVGSEPPQPGHPSKPRAEGSPRTATRTRPRRERSGAAQVPRFPRAARLTLILSTAASSFSCSTRRCMVLRLPADDMTGTGRNGTALRGSARLGSALPGSAGTAGAARGRGRGRSAPRSDPRVMISIFHPRLRLYSFEMPLYRSLLLRSR